MKLRFHNTLTRQEEEFTPLDPAGKRVTFYTCGPTVWDYAHIGNFRSFLNADVLRRALELFGYEVRQVMNMTDVGHMTDDELADGAGEDKMEVAARRLVEAKKSGKLPPNANVDPNDPYAIADFYCNAFIEDSRRLGLKVVLDARAEPALMPRPTRYIEPMIELVQTLIDKGHAYVASDGVVYFDVQSYPEYGRLSGNTPDRVRSGEGGRVNEETQALKKHPADFMLWKPDTTHLMRWASPWGEGFPGWHLECSVMATRLLALDTNGVIDIHSGGEDNIFPHHECEIAQSCGASDEAFFARYWFHGRHLMVEGEKMSKSKGNFFTLGDLVARGHAPAAIRLELIRTHYRSNANFTMQGLKDSHRQITRWRKLAAWLEAHADARLDCSERSGPGPLASALEAFKASFASDLNIAGAIGVLNDAAGAHDVESAPPAVSEVGGDSGGGGGGTYADELAALRAMDSVLGVLDLEHEASLEAGGLDGAMIETKIADRLAARGAKDWATADRIRDELLAMGIEIKDGPEGTTWTRASVDERVKKPIIGIAGGIGSGKTAVAKILARLGCLVTHSDEAARAALEDPDIRETLIKWWGESILDASGAVDRSRLGRIVFASPDDRRRLEALTHPWIEAHRLAQFATAPPEAPALVIDAPLLFEAGLEKACDAVIFVDAPRSLRLQRVRERRGWSEDELQRREDSQLPLDVKRSGADYVIRNDGDLSHLEAQIRTALRSIVEPS